RNVEPHISVIRLAVLCLAGERRTDDSAPRSAQLHCRVLQIPVGAKQETHHGELRSRTDPDHAGGPRRGGDPNSGGPGDPGGVKAHMAEVILKAAAEGQTSYDVLLASASDQIQTILSLLT